MNLRRPDKRNSRSQCAPARWCARGADTDASQAKSFDAEVDGSGAPLVRELRRLLIPRFTLLRILKPPTEDHSSRWGGVRRGPCLARAAQRRASWGIAWSHADVLPVGDQVADRIRPRTLPGLGSEQRTLDAKSLVLFRFAGRMRVR